MKGKESASFELSEEKLTCEGENKKLNSEKQLVGKKGKQANPLAELHHTLPNFFFFSQYNQPFCTAFTERRKTPSFTKVSSATSSFEQIDLIIEKAISPHKSRTSKHIQSPRP